MFTKQHYKAIATIIKGEIDFTQKEGHCYNCRERLRTLVGNMADYFASDNSLFDRQKFLDACGLS